MIPKRIFTIWLSEDGKIPPFIQKCIDSQKLEGYEHKVITLDNCYKGSDYIKQCIDSPYISRKWCKASDYLRMYYLLTEGGIYLDADVEIIPGKNFDHLLHNQAFIGKEVSGELTVLGTAVVGSIPNHPLISKWLCEVEKNFRGDDDKNYESSMHILNTIGVDYQDQMQLLEPEIFYPYNHHTGYTNITKNSISIHHFAKTWTEISLEKFIFYIKNNINFSFVKRGDGELACMNGTVGENCDGHPYSSDLGEKLKISYEFLKTLQNVSVVEFDDQSNYNILLHRTDSNLEKIKNFYSSIIESDRHCTFIGPKKLEGIAKMFGADFIDVPEKNAYSEFENIRSCIIPRDNEIYIFCAGMMSKCLISNLLFHNREITCLDAGSAFDPYVEQTRTFQISTDQFNNLYKEFLNKPKVYSDNFSIPQDEHPEKIYVISHIPDKSGTILDLGCGSHKTLPEAIGVDIRDVTDKVCDIQDLPFGDNNADYVISRHSFEHVLDPVKTMREWIRVLKPLGRMIIILPDHEFINTMDPYYGNGEHLHAYTRKSFKNFLSLFPELKIEDEVTVLENWSFGIVVRKYPKISIIIPQLGREEGLKKCLTSIDKLDYPKDRIETIIIEGPETVPVKVQKGYEKSTGEYIVYGANDMEFHPESIRKALFLSKKEDKGLVAFNSGELSPDNGNICEHFMISKSLVKQLGGIFDTRFHHVGVDNLLWKKASNVGQAIRSEGAKIIHNHFSKGGIYDEIYDKGWKMAERDRELLSRII